MIKSTFVWQVDPVQALGKLNAGIRNKALRVALSAEAAPVKAAVVASAPRDEGHLARSTSIKVKNYRNANVWVAIVGAGAKYKRLKKVKGRTVKGKNGKRQYVRPSAYQYFVDRGTEHVQGRHYLQRSFLRAKRQFETLVKQKLGEVIVQLMRSR